MTDLRVRDVTRDDLPAVLRVRNRSFGPLGSGGEQWWERVADEVIPHRMLAVVDASDQILAAGRARPYEQAWGGRHLAMGGIAGVYVEPSARGTGVASLLMRALVARMAELGDVVSCLFPTVPALYRGVGYEIGGVQPQTTYAAPDVRGLRSLAGGLRPRPAGPDDAELVHAIVRDHQQRHRLHGPMAPSVAAWRHQLADDDAMHYVLDGADGGPRGVVEYALDGGALVVEHLAGESREAAAALWALVGSGSSAAPTVRTWLDPRDPGRLLLDSAPTAEVAEHVWMLRVVDLAGAVAGRGFSPHVHATADVLVDDPDAPACAGLWRLELAEGRGTATRLDGDAGRDPVHLGARGLAGLWTGWTTSRLRASGLAAGGDPEADAALDAMFACTPHITEYF